MKNMDSIISTKDLRKTFHSQRGNVDAVRGVSFDVARGEIFGFLGPNGAGKTTTLRMLTTLLPIGSGTAAVAGFDVASQPKQVRAHVGYVSQLGGADNLATGRENLILQGRLYGEDLQTAKERAEKLMEILDLSEFADRRVKTYSGGQRRRLDVALGIVHQPQVLFLDEPSTGLDPQNRANLWDHVRALREQGATIFVTTHYLEEADALCDRLVIMLGAQPFVREVSADGNEVRLYVEDGGAALPQILRLLDSEQIGVRSMSLSEAALDDVFLHQTGRSRRDSGALADERRSA
jgi:ABC-2 type transport system ATP-binding protein